MLADGEAIEFGDGERLVAAATPGHTSNHLCYAYRGSLFTGDHVMGWSTTVVAPPDGDMGAYLDSLDRVIARNFATLWPTHGAPVTDPAPFLTAYKAHRLAREAQILARVAAGDQRISEIVPNLYAAVDPRLWPAASLSVWAHLIALEGTGRVVARPGPSIDADWTPA